MVRRSPAGSPAGYSKKEASTYFPKASDALVTSDPASQPMSACETKQQLLKKKVVWSQGHKRWEDCPCPHGQQV